MMSQDPQDDELHLHHRDGCHHDRKTPIVFGALTQRLTPVALEPLRQSGNAVPLAMLNQIERVQVRHTVEHAHTTYFVMSVYLRNIDTRLPIASSMLSRLRRRNEDTRCADYRIGARFSDFASLRAEISELLCMNARFTCQYCNSFDEFIKFRVTQPRWIVKVGTRTEQRKSILESFISDFLNMTLQRCQADTKCQARAKAPFVMERFLRRRYPTGQEPTTALDAAVSEGDAAAPTEQLHAGAISRRA